VFAHLQKLGEDIFAPVASQVGRVICICIIIVIMINIVGFNPFKYLQKFRQNIFAPVASQIDRAVLSQQPVVSLGGDHAARASPTHRYLKKKKGGGGGRAQFWGGVWI